MAMGRRTDEGCTVRVTNLSENARDTDLQELFGRIGDISRIFLSKVCFFSSFLIFPINLHFEC